MGAGGGTLYGLNENRKHDESYRNAYAACMHARGYTATEAGLDLLQVAIVREQHTSERVAEDGPHPRGLFREPVRFQSGSGNTTDAGVVSAGTELLSVVFVDDLKKRRLQPLHLCGEGFLFPSSFSQQITNVCIMVLRKG